MYRTASKPRFVRRLISLTRRARKKISRLSALLKSVRMVVDTNLSSDQKRSALFVILRAFLILARQVVIPRRQWSAPTAVWRARLKMGCLVCEIYHRPTMTCGHPDGSTWFNPDTKRIEPMGCFCMMPLAAKVAEKTCWLVDKCGANDTFGWPDEINGRNYERNKNP